MRTDQPRCRPCGLLWGLLLGLAFVGISPPTPLAAADQAKGLSPRVARLLRWLPEDTETLIVARSVTLPERPRKPQDADWLDFGMCLAIADLGLGGQGEAAERLRGRKIECVVNGARSFKAFDPLGGVCSENCAIIVFEEGLGDAGREWTEALRKRAVAVHTRVGREVFVFPRRGAPCQDIDLVLLAPDTVLCATGHRYLEEVLRRADAIPASRALADDLPEWKRVDFEAPVWMLRHIPEDAGKTRAVGVTTAFTKNGFRVTYIPSIGSDFDMQDISRAWLPDHLLQAPAARDKLKVARQPGGTVVVSSTARLDADDVTTYWFVWQLCFLQAFERFDPGK